MSSLDAVLQWIDRDLDASLQRLFALLRIQSISTDPAYKDFCRAAAEHVAADLNSIGFATELRPTQGHPVVIGKAGNGAANGKHPRVLRTLEVDWGQGNLFGAPETREAG